MHWTRKRPSKCSDQRWMASLSGSRVLPSECKLRGSTDCLQCIIAGAHFAHVSIALCLLSKCCLPIILHGPQLSLECTAGSHVCSLGSLITRFCKQTIMEGAFPFKQLLDFFLSASSNQSWCFLVEWPTTSAVVSCCTVFLCFHCSSGSAAVIQ